MSYTNSLFFQLVFDYNIAKLVNTGRAWAPDAYKHKDYIFEYSAASAATFLQHNSHFKFNIYTDDVDLFNEKISKYNLNFTNFNIIDINKELAIWTQHSYAFNPAMMIMHYHKNTDYDIIFMDNDLPILGSFDRYMDFNGIIEGHYQHHISRGNPLWGCDYACRGAFGTDDFPEYNKSVLGLTNKLLKTYGDEAIESMEKLLAVDIQPVTDVKSHVWHCCEQTAWSWLIYKYKIPVIETKDVYKMEYTDKSDVINFAKMLLR